YVDMEFRRHADGRCAGGAHFDLTLSRCHGRDRAYHDFKLPGDGARCVCGETARMTVDSHTAYPGSLAEVRAGTNPGTTSAAARLPRQVLNILLERGMVTGAVLLLTSGPPRLGNSASAPQFHLTRGEIGAAATLLNQGDFAAVVLMLEGPLSAAALEPLLASVAAGLKPDALLVLELHGRRAGD